MRAFVPTALALAACADPVPDAPTWFADVQPIVMANCARCHGADPDPETPPGVRLDRYVAGDDDTADAWDYQESIRVRAAVEATMPVDYALSARQRAVIERWVAAGAPKGERGNQLPSAELVSPAEVPAQVDQQLAIAIRARDPDGDAVAVSVGVRDLVSRDAYPMAAGLGGGMRAVAVDTGQLASGRDFEVYAVVDDGFADDPVQNQHEVVLIASLRVDHGVRGTAPTVRLLEPNGGQSLLGATTIAWTATDPDVGDTLRADLDLLRVAADGSIAVAASIATGVTGAASYTWDPSTVPASDGAGPIAYRVRVTVSDGQNQRSDDSDASFSIAPPMVPTTLTWDDVRPTFVTYCAACHGQPARVGALEYFRLDKYDAADPVAPITTDSGVYEVRALVYQRMVAEANMPPASAPRPTAAERDAIGRWILGGAPRTAGPVDAPPTFVWTTPNDSAISRTTTGTIALAWTAADPEGQALTGTIAYAPLAANSDQMARCDGALTGWTTLPAAVSAGAYTWSVPARGYYCLRGEVSDPGGHTTTRTALRPVKYSTTPGP